jgi:[ribosomal protein S18]-alanine N-acetyltransferase
MSGSKADEIEIREAIPADVDAILRVQEQCPELSRWAPPAYLAHRVLLAVVSGAVVGFIVYRTIKQAESEILNVGVDPEYRRRGIARRLVEAVLSSCTSPVFLEVRSSNFAAQNLYNSLGFRYLSERSQYYEDPPESAIVMKFCSC